MYLTPNDRAILFYGGLIGAFLSSENASNFDLNNHPWKELQEGIEWLRYNNSLFRTFFTLSIPRVNLNPSNSELRGTNHLRLYFEFH